MFSDIYRELEALISALRELTQVVCLQILTSSFWGVGGVVGRREP